MFSLVGIRKSAGKFVTCCLPCELIPSSSSERSRLVFFLQTKEKKSAEIHKWKKVTQWAKSPKKTVC